MGSFPGPNTITGAFIWGRCTIGDIAFPPDAHEGAAVVKVKSSQKIDQKQASGKNKAKSTQKGRPPCPVTIEMEFTARGWPLVEEALTAIDPNSPSSGGPFSFSHPDAERRGVKFIMIDEVGEVEWRGHKGSVKISATQWEDPAKVVSGSAGQSASDSKKAQLDSLLHEMDTVDAAIEQMIANPADDATAWRKNIEQLQEQRSKLDSAAREVQSSLTSTSETAKGVKDSVTKLPGTSGWNPQSGSTSSVTQKPDPYGRTGAPNGDP